MPRTTKLYSIPNTVIQIMMTSIISVNQLRQDTHTIYHYNFYNLIKKHKVRKNITQKIKIRRRIPNRNAQNYTNIVNNARFLYPQIKLRTIFNFFSILFFENIPILLSFYHVLHICLFFRATKKWVAVFRNINPRNLTNLIK